jgi:ABC-type uncharacterized transport system auxiliary subunit
MMRALFLLPLLMLGGCITLLPEPPPPPAVFALEARDVAESTNAPVDAVIGIAIPTGERAILGSDLIWRTGDQLAFVSQTQWSGRADSALQSMLAETLIRQGRFRSATRSGEARAEFEIRWEVLDFEIDEASMQARFAAEVRLVQSPGRRIVASTIVNTNAPVSDRSATQAANALARAAREGSARIGEFAADAAAEAMTAPAAAN